LTIVALLPVQHWPVVLALKARSLTVNPSFDTDRAALSTLVNVLGWHFILCHIKPLAAVHGCFAVETICVAFDVGHPAFGSRVDVAIQRGKRMNAVSIAETLGSVEGLRV